MVKRRNSPYASFDRAKPRRVRIVCEPALLEAMPTHPRQRFPKVDPF